METGIKRRVDNKLKSRSGESISETLVALLISALALVMLAGAVSSASRIVTTGRTTLDAYYKENENMVLMDTDAAQGGNTSVSKGYAKITDTDVKVEVAYYQNEGLGDDHVISYIASEED